MPYEIIVRPVSVDRTKEHFPQGFVVRSIAQPALTAETLYHFLDSRQRHDFQYLVDSMQIVQVVPEVELVHVGRQTPQFLRVMLIEPSNHDEGQFEEVWKRAVWLLAVKCARYGWSVERNIQSCSPLFYCEDCAHSDPVNFFTRYGRTWADFLSAVDEMIKQEKGERGISSKEHATANKDLGERASNMDNINGVKCKTPILGVESINVEQCEQYLHRHNKEASEIVKYYKKYGEILGIRWGYAVAQMIKETGYLKYGGDVLPHQNNFAGIGAAGKGASGASFATPEEGVLAHLEHLYAYACKEPLPENIPKVDPRFDLVTRGSCPHWEDLNGRWAVPGEGYGESIVYLYGKMASEVIGDEEKAAHRFIRGWLGKLGKMLFGR